MPFILLFLPFSPFPFHRLSRSYFAAVLPLNSENREQAAAPVDQREALFSNFEKSNRESFEERERERASTRFSLSLSTHTHTHSCSAL